MPKFKHGGFGTPEYRVWCAIKQRCLNPEAPSWADYGGRGITVCERWLEFPNFLADMGVRPSPKHSIDRFPDNDGNYQPGNCRWATWQEQARNRRTTRLVEFRGESKPLKDWCELLGLDYETTIQRIVRQQWSIQDALTLGTGTRHGWNSPSIARRRRPKNNRDQVRRIRALAASGVEQREIAALFGIGQATVSQIVRRETWKDVE